MSLVENLVKSYDGFKIEIPRWEILDQGITALQGASGSGKTSVLRILLGLEDCKGLSWTVKNEDLAGMSVSERRLGVVFQSLELFPHLSARENILFAAKARSLGSNEMNLRLEELSDVLQMTSFLSRKAKLLSGGEKQRVAIARALIAKPRILFLDEPFSALDEAMKADARKLLKKVLEAEKIPAVLVTHDQRDIEILANKVSQISQGKIVNETV